VYYSGIHLERLSETTEFLDQDKRYCERNSHRQLPKLETRPLTLDHLDFFLVLHYLSTTP
jgi:hypothetical protein